MYPKVKLNLPTSKRIRDERGFSLTEALVAATIATIVMVAIGSMMSAQYREGRALTEKLAALDIEKLMITALADGRICGYQFQNHVGVASNTFNGSGLSDTTTASIKMSYVPSAPVTGATPLVQLQSSLPTGAQASPLTPTLQISDISLANIRPAGPDNWLAEYTITFDTSKLVRGLHAVSVRTTLQTTGSIGNKTITGCVGSGLATTNSGTGTGTGSTPTPGLCVPGLALYKGTVAGCNIKQLGYENTIDGCPAVYVGNLCLMQ